MVQGAGFLAGGPVLVFKGAVGHESGTHIELVCQFKAALLQASQVEVQQFAPVVGVVPDSGHIQVHVTDDQEAVVLICDGLDGVVDPVEVLLLLRSRPLPVDGTDRNPATRHLHFYPDVRGGVPDHGGVILGDVVLPDEQQQPVQSLSLGS